MLISRIPDVAWTRDAVFSGFGPAVNNIVNGICTTSFTRFIAYFFCILQVSQILL